jgi:hypothetical protein
MMARQPEAQSQKLCGFREIFSTKSHKGSRRKASTALRVSSCGFVDEKSLSGYQFINQRPVNPVRRPVA